MALFKIYKGLSNNLKNTPNPQKENVTQLTKEGHCYFTTDDGKFYIDIVNNVIPIYPNADGSNFAEVTRMPINAFKADRAAIAEWSARALADVNGNDIHTHYAHSLGIDGYKLKLIAADTTNLVLSEVTLPSDVETAKKFTSDQIIKLTGAVIGEHKSQAGWEIATTLANNIVTTAKINNSAVTNTKIADGAVTNGKIANSTISNAKLVNSSININGASVSLGGSLTLADIGLSSALRFIGVTATAIVDGGTTSPVSVNGSNITPTIGDVVINSNNNQEYVWLGSTWELLGDESSYALKDHTHNQYLQNAYTSIGVNNNMYDAEGATSLNFRNGAGISLSIGVGKNEDYDITITNSGVRSITSGSTNGTINVNTNGTSNEVAIKGLKSAAYTDESSYVKSISIEEISGNLTPVLKYTKSNGTTTVGNIDFRVLQSKLSPFTDSYSSAVIPVLLSNPAARGNNYTGVSYYSAMTYCPDTGYLEGIKIDCGLWESFNGDIDDCCFIAGTQVLIDLSGNTKNIEDIKPGDNAVAYNLTEEKNYLAIVKKVHVKHDVTDVAIVNFENGATLIMNAYHPIYTVNGYHSLTNHNGYDMLLIGDNCRTEKGWSKIISIDRYNSTPITMYSLDVIDINENIDNDINDNFFANGIVVHNASCPS